MLHTRRLSLRNLCPADLSTLFDYRNDIRCNQYQRYDDTSEKYLQALIAHFSHSVFPSKETEQHYAVVSKTDRKMIGDLSVFFTEKDNCFTLGITVAPGFQRQGYAYEILGEVIRQLQDHYPSADIVALIEKNNAKSICLFKKLNFTEECFAESIGSYVFTIYGRHTDVH